MSLGFDVLLWLHIVSVAGWLGSGMVFGALIGPTLPTLSPASRGELIVKLFPKYIRYAQLFAILTPLFGIALMLYISHGSFAIFTPNNNFSTFIVLGAVWTVVAWALVFGVLSPTSSRIVRLVKESAGGPPSPDLQGALKNLRVSAVFGLLVLFVIVACMVHAATG